MSALLVKRDRPLQLTVVGLSRGGIGALLLVQQLRQARAPRHKCFLSRRACSHDVLTLATCFLSRRVCSLHAVVQMQEMTGEDAVRLRSAERLHVSLCLYDPVPGNLIRTVQYLDWLGVSTASSVLDVSDCPVHECLAIYPYEPLPDLAFHAPILPQYPASCRLDEDATLGCHQGALYEPAAMSARHPLHAACTLSQHRVSAFLERCGVRFASEAPSAATLAQACLAICESALGMREASTRSAHAASRRGARCTGTVYGEGAVVRREYGRLLNRHHRLLLEAHAPDDPRLHHVAAGVVKDGVPLGDSAPYMLGIKRPE